MSNLDPSRDPKLNGVRLNGKIVPWAVAFPRNYTVQIPKGG